MSRLLGPAYCAREGGLGGTRPARSATWCPAVRRKGPPRLDHGLQSRVSRDRGSPSREQFLARWRPSRRCRMTQLVERNWQTLAACRSADPALFFPLSSSGKSLGRWPRRCGSALQRSSGEHASPRCPLQVHITQLCTNRWPWRSSPTNRPYRRLGERISGSATCEDAPAPSRKFAYLCATVRVANARICRE